MIVTGDKDMSQLVREGIRVYDIAKEQWLDDAGVREKFGVAPRQIPDLLALSGDSIDNIPGVRGIGEKTARQILSVCASIEDLADPGTRFESVSIRARNQVLSRIRENLQAVRLGRQLATICCDVPIHVTPEALHYRKGDPRLLTPLCEELGLQQLLEEIPLVEPLLF